MRYLALLTLVACDPAPTAPPAPAIAPILASSPQGIKGEARFKRGDFMPGPEGVKRGGEQGFAVGSRVHVFRGKRVVVAKLDKTAPTYAGSGVVHADGSYAIPLDRPGTYTPLLERAPGDLFNPCTSREHDDPDGPEMWCWIEVKAGEWTDKLMLDERGATY